MAYPIIKNVKKWQKALITDQISLVNNIVNGFTLEWGTGDISVYTDANGIPTKLSVASDSKIKVSKPVWEGATIEFSDTPSPKKTYVLVEVYQLIVSDIRISDDLDKLKHRFEEYTRINYDEADADPELLGDYDQTKIFELGGRP